MFFSTPSSHESRHKFNIEFTKFLFFQEIRLGTSCEAASILVEKKCLIFEEYNLALASSKDSDQTAHSVQCG